MANTLAHKVECELSLAADTLLELQNALDNIGVELDTPLDAPHFVELLAETLSDGSIVKSVRVWRTSD